MTIVLSIVDFPPSGLYKSPFGRFIWFWMNCGGSRVKVKRAIELDGLNRRAGGRVGWWVGGWAGWRAVVNVDGWVDIQVGGRNVS